MATLRKKTNVSNDLDLIIDGGYVVKDWTVREGSKKTIQTLIEKSDKYKYVDLDRPCDVMAKSRNDGTGIFLKLKMYLTVGGYMEYDFSYNKKLSIDKYEEGDQIDTSTLEFFVEEKLGDVHPYAIGKVITEDESAE